MKQLTRRGVRIVYFSSIFEFFYLSDDIERDAERGWLYGQDETREGYLKNRRNAGGFIKLTRAEIKKDKDLQYLLQLGHTLKKTRLYSENRGRISIPKVIRDSRKYRKTKSHKLKRRTIRVAFCPTLSAFNSSGRLEGCGKELVKVLTLLEIMGINYTVEVIFGFQGVSRQKPHSWFLRTSLKKKDINIVRHSGMTRHNSYGWCFKNIPKCNRSLGMPFEIGEIAEHFDQEFDLFFGTAAPGQYMSATLKVINDEHFKKANSPVYRQAQEAIRKRAGASLGDEMEG